MTTNEENQRLAQEEIQKLFEQKEQLLSTDYLYSPSIVKK